MYSIKVLEDKKVIHVVTGGFMNEKDGQQIYDKLKQTFSSVNTSKYNFILDTSDYKAVAQDNVPILQEILKLYASTPFRKKFVIMPSSAIAKMQAQKNIKDKSSDEIKYVSSFDEAISMI